MVGTDMAPRLWNVINELTRFAERAEAPEAASVNITITVRGAIVTRAVQVVIGDPKAREDDPGHRHALRVFELAQMLVANAYGLEKRWAAEDAAPEEKKEG